MGKKYMWRFIYRLSSPPSFYRITEALCPWLLITFVLLITYGLYGALISAPVDYQQGEGYRIIFVHVPAAWLSMFIYVNMAVMAMVTLIWRGKIAAICTRASAPVGAVFTFLTLVTGSVWGKPMWGTWWVWDARLTSELILLFLYIGYMGMASTARGNRGIEQNGAILLLVGVVNIPIIHFSVDWWNTLHQPSTITRLGMPTIHIDMLLPLLSMALAFMVFYVIILCIQAQALLLEKEKNSRWVKRIIFLEDDQKT